ncbi:MAG: LysR family transcriptional regulator [Hyphomonadaceae bacterium]|nr:MAG: LysR family transcriptional regulator [Caulobacteraceae bacterium]MBT9446804.1 LysR family transcriptional regulator [Hyphomonadaceae bacterium]TPW06336.1 MAG: LysR family transcriptional regulator [Alphaproteobacteria bacterium]
MAAISLDLFAVFARVAETGSFSKAARDLGLSKATVSKRVAELEGAFGVALVARTTRRASLTEAGERTLVHAQRILEEADAARDEALEARASPRGRLKITAPITFGLRYLAPILPEFLKAYPDIQLDVSLGDKTVDLIGEGFDAAVRIGAMEDSSLMARKLAPVRAHVVASPAYWDAFGRPARPEDLAGHRCFTYANLANADAWRFENAGGQRVVVRMESIVAYDNADLVEPAICAGLGVARQPDFICWRDLQSGRLEAVLEDWASAELWLHVLTPPGRGAPKKMRAFSDFMHDHFGGGKAPWVKGRGL